MNKRKYVPRENERLFAEKRRVSRSLYPVPGTLILDVRYMYRKKRYYEKGTCTTENVKKYIKMMSNYAYSDSVEHFKYRIHKTGRYDIKFTAEIFDYGIIYYDTVGQYHRTKTSKQELALNTPELIVDNKQRQNKTKRKNQLKQHNSNKKIVESKKNFVRNRKLQNKKGVGKRDYHITKKNNNSHNKNINISNKSIKTKRN